MKSPIRLGLTGGIGCGKSTVAAMFAERGADMIDADALSRATTAAGGAAIEAIRTVFGDAMIDNTGAMDRAAMRALVFSDAKAKRRLEAIIHPLVGLGVNNAVLSAKSGLVVHDIPLLVEGGIWGRKLDYVLVVDCCEATQIRRVLARPQSNSWTLEQIQRTIAQQAPRQQRLAAADIVIANDSDTLSQLAYSVQLIIDHFGL